MVEEFRSVAQYATSGPTRIYGPTGHAIGGTAQQALQSSSAAAAAAGPRHYQLQLLASLSSRGMDLAAAAAVVRGTRMNLLRANCIVRNCFLCL